MCDRMVKTQGFYLEDKCGIPGSTAASIAREGIGYRVCVATKDYLAGLLIHLSTLIMTSGWDAAKEDLDFHVRELNMDRNRAHGRLACIFVTYVYLRELSANLWTHPRLREQSYQASKASMSLCKHCGGSFLVHPPSERCLWADKRAENAKKERAKKMRGA